MKLSIAKQLGLGFGLIIVLMLVSATIAFVNLTKMNRNIVRVVDEAMPTVRNCDQLRDGVNESLAALRGYMILGANPQQAEAFKAERRSAWKRIDTSLADLTRRVANRNDRVLNDTLGEIHQNFQEFRAAQQAAEDAAHRDDNIAAVELFVSRGAPHAQAALKSLTVLIDEERLQEASHQRRELFAALADSRGSLAQSLASIRAFLLSGDAAHKREFEEHWQVNHRALEQVRGSSQLFTPSQIKLWSTYVEARGEFDPLPSNIFALREADDWNRAQYILRSEAAPRANRLKKSLATVAAAVEYRKVQSRGEMEAAARTASFSLILATIAAIAIGSTIAVLLSRKIVAMVRLLAGRADEISAGDLTGSALLAKSGDELGQLADGFDAMLQNLKDLTGQIHSVTENVNSATSQISSSAQQQACSTREQAATVQEVTSTMQEIAQSGSQIVDKAKQVAAAAEAATQQSKSGIDAVRNTNRTMESIREQVEEVAENIVALSEQTQAVGEIISTVNDIAEQSNLLALNATIEAAEAGDDGNRFSVVANEMKNLADQAKDCTLQVRNILGEIQKGINSAVMLTEEAVKRVESGKQQAEMSEDAIRQMSHSTEKSAQAFQQIMGATNQQQIGFEQVSKGMQDIDAATQQTASGTAQLEHAVASLSSMSQQLKAAVSTYRLQA